MNAESVKTRLKNFAIDNGITFQEALTYYGLERTIYRISVSKYAEHFVLKGGIFLYAIYDRSYERATTDVDFLARRISNSSEEMKQIFMEILTENIDDALVFDLNSVEVENISEFKEYHGLRVSTIGYLDRTRIPVSIDVGFGDVIYPDAVKMDFPVLLDMEPPRVNAYSIESSIAEKLEAIVSNGYLNSRYKDFYDVYVLSLNNRFNYQVIHNAVLETFENRKTQMNMGCAAFTDEFLSDPIHKTRWDSFLKKKKALIQVSLVYVIDRIKTFARPLFENNNMNEWDPKKGCWH